jgi:hypothetical protein
VATRYPALRAAVVGVGLCVLAWAIPGGGAEAIQSLGRRLACVGDDLVLTEPDLNRVVVYDVSGGLPRKRVAFGEAGSKAGQLAGPHGALLDGEDLFVADTFNHRVQVFRLGDPPAPRPRLVRTWGAFGSAIGELSAPQSGFAMAARGGRKGLLFVPDTRNHRVQAFRTTGEPAGVVLGGPGTEPGRLDTPMAAAFDPTGAILYVAEAGNRRISAFDPMRARLWFAFDGEPDAPFTPGGLAVDQGGTVYVTDMRSRQVRLFRPVARPDGEPRGLKAAGAWGRTGSRPGEWTYPHAIAVDAKDRVYVCDLADDRCQVFTADGRFLGAFGDDVGESPLPEASPGGDQMPRSVCSNGGSYRVSFIGAPFAVPGNELFGFEMGIAEGCEPGRPLPDVPVAVDAVMPLHRHGMNTQARVRPRGDGRYVVEGLRLHMSGHWEIHVDVTREGVTERAQTDVWVE